MITTAIFGSSGLVGRYVAEQLSADSSVERVLTYARSQPSNLPPKCEYHPFSLNSFEIPKGVNVVYCALGTTIRKAGSREEFQRVDLHSVASIAKHAHMAGVERFAVVSSIGANPNSGNFYLRTKGQMEEALKAIGFKRLVILRPSLLLGPRSEKRVGEDIARVLFKVLRFLFVGPLANYAGVEAGDVASTMIHLAQNGEGTVTVDSKTIKKTANEFKG